MIETNFPENKEKWNVHTKTSTRYISGVEFELDATWLKISWFCHADILIRYQKIEETSLSNFSVWEFWNVN